MTRNRISHSRRWGAIQSRAGSLITVAALAGLATACGGVDDSMSDEIAATPDKTTELSRPLDPTRPVEDDAELGSSFDDMLAAATTGAEALGSGGYSCSIDHYVVGDLVVAVDELCPGHYRRAMLFGDGAQGPQTLLYVYGDFDVDGRIDGWFDPTRGFALEDADRDGIPDRSRTTTDHIEPDVVESFANGWTAPEYIDEHVLEDTDLDGHYDLETLIAGQTPDGEATYWVEE